MALIIIVRKYLANQFLNFITQHRPHKIIMSNTKENRLAGRYPTSCIVELDSGNGVTRDLSTAGVCFTTNEPIIPNSMLRCFIPMEKKGRNLTRLRCEGRVVRTSKSAEGWEIAVHFTTLDW